MSSAEVARRSLIAGKYRLYIPINMDLSIFTEKNPYGFALRINNPKVLAWYQRFKTEKNLPYTIPISDSEREEFEIRIFNALKIKYEIYEH